MSPPLEKDDDGFSFIEELKDDVGRFVLFPVTMDIIGETMNNTAMPVAKQFFNKFFLIKFDPL